MFCLLVHSYHSLHAADTNLSMYHKIIISQYWHEHKKENLQSQLTEVSVTRVNCKDLFKQIIQKSAQ